MNANYAVSFATNISQWKNTNISESFQYFQKTEKHSSLLLSINLNLMRHRQDYATNKMVIFPRFPLTFPQKGSN